ncbi:hypothetical protein [Flavobacterium sp.]|uniref:hypothetical protein n=1 Tax=Flavobacterium sp. TaxID=239 RepID=UPI004033C531
MKKQGIKLAGMALLMLASLCWSCKQNDKPDEGSYGESETERRETPTSADDATNDPDSVTHETGPGSATVGDTLHKTPQRP